MFCLNPFKWKRPAGKKAGTTPAGNGCQGEVANQLEISIGEIRLKINRCQAFPPVNELSAFIPRAEIRRRYYANGRLAAEEEIILNSITLVDAPRHLEKNANLPKVPYRGGSPDKSL